RGAPPVTGSIGTPPSNGSVLPPLPPAQSAPTGSEPKRVRTETIRPDQAASPSPAAPPARLANAPPAATSRSVAPPPPAPTRSANAPTQQSTPWQPISSGASSGASTATEGGSYVQISSQLSEADAQASLKALQAKYPSQLGNQPAIVRRVDLSDKGKGIV